MPQAAVRVMATEATPKAAEAAVNAAPKVAEAFAQEVTAYSRSMSWMHWVMSAGLFTTIGTVLAAQNTQDKKAKADYMMYHKSFGLLMGGLILGRLGLRFGAKVPALPEGHAIERLGAHAGHLALYGMMVFMPASGVAMGYYGGKGLPFFGYTIPGAEKANGAIAKSAYQYHKLAGQAFEYLIPIHVGAVGWHAIKGTNILTRISPFASKAIA